MFLAQVLIKLNFNQSLGYYSNVFFFFFQLESLICLEFECLLGFIKTELIVYEVEAQLKCLKFSVLTVCILGHICFVLCHYQCTVISYKMELMKDIFLLYVMY